MCFVLLTRGDFVVNVNGFLRVRAGVIPETHPRVRRRAIQMCLGGGHRKPTEGQPREGDPPHVDVDEVAQ